jgi:hypothetical protein
MALNTNPFVEGIDPSATFGGYASVLLQLIRQAQPSSTYGMILFDTTAPDVTGANAWRKRCIWINLTVPGTPTVNVYKEGGSPGWTNVQSVIPNNTITTAMIQNAAVTLAKLSVSGGTANQLIRVNGTGTAFEFVSLASLVTAGSILPSAISGVAVAPGTFRLLGNLNGGTTTWYSPTEVAQGIADAGIDVVQIAPSTTAAARSRFITTRTADTTATWRYFEPNVDILASALNGNRLTDLTVSPAKITPSATEGALLSVVGGVADWIPAPPVVTAFTSTIATTVTQGIPVVGTPTTLAHSLAAVPISYRVALYCQTGDGNYNNGDEIEASNINAGSAGDWYNVFNFLVTSTNVVVSRFAGGNITVLNKTTGATHTINESRWRLRLYAMKVV